MPSRALVIQVVSCETTEATRAAYAASDPRSDLVELRLDGVRDLDLDRLLATRGKPKLITVRSRQHGGGARRSEREAILRAAHAAGVEYIDIEPGDEKLPFLGRRGGPRRILSLHNLDATPVELPALLGRMLAVPDIALYKLVTYADAVTDNLRVRELLRATKRKDLIAFCMGPKGVPSRILAPLWGSAAIYAPARGAAQTAAGQVPLEDLFDLYRFDRIGNKTRLLGLIGGPVGHSLSPVIHNTALEALDLDYCYIPFEAETLAEFLPLLSELPIAGLSVTLPHKEKILHYLDSLDLSARRAGAVNTVLKVWNRLEGYNTDTEAALAPLQGRIDLAKARVALMGAGGAARALIDGLVRAGSRVTVFNRTQSRAIELARRFGVRTLPWVRLRGFRCDLLVNATSVGLAPHADRSPVPASWIAAPLVYDIIYNPAETVLMRHARRRGAEVIGGVEMFLAQGAAQFELFTGRKPPLERMREAILEALGPAASPRRRRAAPRERRSRGRR